MKPHQRARVFKLAAKVIAQTKIDSWWIGDWRHIVADPIRVHHRLVNLCRRALDVPEFQAPPNPAWAHLVRREIGPHQLEAIP